MDFPSGDQANGDDGGPGGWLLRRLQAPLVRRRAVPPLAGTIQTCDGVGAAGGGEPASPPSDASVCASVSFLFSGSSGVTLASSVPAGFHADCSTPFAPPLARPGPPPPPSGTQNCGP